MKKKLLVVCLMVVLAGGAAMADHPGGWGIGIVGQQLNSWDGFGDSFDDFRYGLSLKAPQLPIFWGINLKVQDGLFLVNVSGDNYFIDEDLVSDIGLGWYLGLGGYAGVSVYSGVIDYMAINVGARVPIGLSWMPIDFLELFIDVAPSLGLAIGLGDAPDSFSFPEGGLGFDLGLRFWI